MALKGTVFKAELQVADMDRAYYGSHNLTLIQHPSETDERLMVRLLAFALFASDTLEFGRGLSTDDEPDLWSKDLTGAIELWIDVGLPDEREIRKSSGRARHVVVLCYGGRAVHVWWNQNRDKLERLRNLTVFNLPLPATATLGAMASRSMVLQVTVQDRHVWVSGGTESLEMEPEILFSGETVPVGRKSW